MAREIAERSGITEGLVCVLSTLEPCWTFALRWDDASYVRPARRKCLFLFNFYLIDRELGLIHSSSRPGSRCSSRCTSTVTSAGPQADTQRRALHEARQRLPRVDDLRRAQRFPIAFTKPRLGPASRPLRLTPSIRCWPEMLAPLRYYWVTAQAEYSTDILFTSRQTAS